MTAPVYASASRDRLDLVRRRKDGFELALSPAVWERDHRLIVDLYSAARHVHPEGHIGWWAHDLARREKVRVSVSRSGRRWAVAFQGGAEAGDRWVNPDFRGEDVDSLSLHVVLREAGSTSIVFDAIIPVYRSSSARDAAERARAGLAGDLRSVRGAHPRWFGWPADVRVHLIAPDIRAGDAVGELVISVFRMLTAGGVPCGMYACNFDPELRGAIRHTSALLGAAGPRDVLVHFFSTYDPYLDSLAALNCRKVVWYQGITPPRMLLVFNAELAGQCGRALEQFGLFRSFQVLVGTSSAICAELAAGLAADATPGATTSVGREVRACPPFIGQGRWDLVPEEDVPLPEAGELLLYVGRLVPHKKVEDLFGLFEEYRRLRPDSALVVAGRPAVGGYGNYIRYLLERRYPQLAGSIFLTGEVTPGQLKRLYSRASCFVTMSEHEGFCVPLVEAMHFDKPVFAWGQLAVRQTLGRSGVVFLEKDPAAMAREIRRVLGDAPEREKVLAGQRRRLAELSAEADGRGVWRFLETALESHAGPV